MTEFSDFFHCHFLNKFQNKEKRFYTWEHTGSLITNPSKVDAFSRIDMTLGILENITFLNLGKCQYSLSVENPQKIPKNVFSLSFKN